MKGPAWVLAGVMAALCIPAGAAPELFESAVHREGFMRALAQRDLQYDAAEKMLAGQFSSPGYHTTLKDGTVHRTRDSLGYAVALFDSGEPWRIERGKDIVRRVIGLQDQDPASRTYGIWSWFLEEPLEKMSPPDWNWANFCAAQLLQIALEHDVRLDGELRRQIREAILHACASIKRRDVKPGYTNIALMGAYVTLAAGELYGEGEFFDYGLMCLRRFDAFTVEKGSFSEYNSPTYTVVAIAELSRMMRHVREAEARRLIEKLNRFAWHHAARRFHAPTQQWAGPHSRCYRTLLSSSTLAFIQRAAGSAVRFVSEASLAESLDAHRIGAACPKEFIDCFVRLDEPRCEIEAFVLNDGDSHDIIGTTWLHPTYTVGSVNIGDMWNQRRPLLAYWQTANGPAAMRLRCLHDGYDYSSASVFCVQDKGDVLAAVVFATDRGDTHISLDRIDGTIAASDISVWLELEGAVEDVKLPQSGQLNSPFVIGDEAISCSGSIAYCAFDGFRPEMRVRRGEKGTAVGISLYAGEERRIDFAAMSEAAVILALSMNAKPVDKNVDTFSGLTVTAEDGMIAARWIRKDGADMELRAPQKPMKGREQQKQAAGRLGAQDAWKVDRSVQSTK
ncbi:MAG: hypothetical protein IH624_17265 [Phycisphaerae bacterium]|nr:hypothetical protein [Phycisphaerae bacterium]